MARPLGRVQFEVLRALVRHKYWYPALWLALGNSLWHTEDPRLARSAWSGCPRRQSKTSFFEDKDKKWKIYFAGFLKVPLNDVEYVVKLYELTGRGQQVLATIEQFTDSRGQASLISNLQLERKTIGANKQLLMTSENRGKVLASSRFKILGEHEKRTGKVDFSEDEANGKIEE